MISLSGHKDPGLSQGLVHGGHGVILQDCAALSAQGLGGDQEAGEPGHDVGEAGEGRHKVDQLLNH